MLPAEKVFEASISTDPSKRWKSVPPVLGQLQNKAKQLGLWNLWLSGGDFQGMAGGEGGGLTNLEVSRLNFVNAGADQADSTR